jgi:hypothetical protein
MPTLATVRFRSRLAAGCALATLLVGACGGGGSPGKLAPSGYVVTTQLAVPPAALLPEVGQGVLAALRTLRTDPAKTIFSLMDAAGTPLVADLEKALPSAVSSTVKDWIGGAIAAHIDEAKLDALIAVIDSTLTNVEIHGELTFDAAGARATHKITALGFGGAAGTRLPIADSGTVKIVADADAKVDAGRLLLGEHVFAVPVGAYAWQAIEAQAKAKLGGDPATLINGAVDCKAAAAKVAGKGVFGLTVGHESELFMVCQTGLILVLSDLQKRVSALEWKLLRFKSGQAVIGAGTLNGTWEAELDVGLGVHPVKAKLTGKTR